MKINSCFDEQWKVKEDKELFFWRHIYAFSDEKSIAHRIALDTLVEMGAIV